MPQMEPVDGEARALGFQFEERDIRGLVDEARKVDKEIAIVIQDVAICEQHYRVKGYYSRWNDDDRLYKFLVPQQYWEGTQIPRSSIGVPVVLEHVNALSAQINDIMFEEDPPFHPLPHSGTRQDEQRAIEEVIEWANDKTHIEREMTGTTDSGLLHGTGLQKFYVEFKGGYFCPRAEYVEREFVFVSPKTRWPDVRQAPYVCHQMYRTVDELDKMRDTADLTIPSLEVMMMWAIPDQETPTQTNKEHVIGVGGTPYAAELGPRPRYKQDSIDPKQWKVEVLEYATPTEVITVLNRKKLAGKRSNVINGKEWGSVRWGSCYFIRQDGEFDGMGVGQLNGQEQTLQQGVKNLQVDNLALSINKMIVRAPGTNVFSQPIKISPGRIIDADPDKIKILEVGGIDPSSFQFLQDSDAAATRRSGANEVAVQGAFPESSGGIGRTAQGMALLAQGATARLRRYVKTVEEQVFIHWLEWLVECFIPYYMDQGLLKVILGPKSKNVDLKSMKQFSSKMKFKFLAATKMKRRAAMLAAVPTIIQHYQNEFVLDSIKSQFKKVDHSQIDRMLWDAAGWPNEYQVITDMSKDEKEQVMSENQLVQQLTVMRATEQIKGAEKLKQIEADSSGKIIKEVIKDALRDGNVREEQKYQASFDQGAQAANMFLDQYVPPTNMQEFNNEQQQQLQPRTRKSNSNR